jgi:hypothetical protein
LRRGSHPHLKSVKQSPGLTAIFFRTQTGKKPHQLRHLRDRRCVGCSGTVLFGSVALCRSGWISWAAIVPAPLVAGLFKWRQFEPKVFLLAVGWYLRSSPRTATSRNPGGEGPRLSRHGGAMAMSRKWNDVSSATQNQPTIVGAWTKLMCALKATGCTCTGSWTQRCDDQFPSLGQTRYSGDWAPWIHIVSIA